MTEHKLVIGITGENGSGKTHLANHLRQRGFGAVSISGLLKLYLGEDNPSREELRTAALQLEAEEGRGYLAAVALSDPSPYLAIESVRLLSIAERIKAAGGVLVAVTAPELLRYVRVSLQGRPESGEMSLGRFVADEAAEAYSFDRYGHNIEAIRAMADYEIVNDGSVSDFHSSAEAILGKIGVTAEVLPPS